MTFVLEQETDESLNIQASEDEITANFEALEARALELYARDQDSALELGKALIAVRDALRHTHGAFTAWYRDHDLDENRVHYCIRKVEGKIATPPKKRATESIDIPDADFVLNKHNLAVGKFAPAHDGKFNVKVVRVDSNGTTATDGFVLVQVSLPPGQPANRKRNQGNCSREMFIRAAQTLNGGRKDAPTDIKDRCWVSLGEETNVLATHDTAIQYERPDHRFPAYEKVIPKDPPITTLHLGGTLQSLIDVLAFARDFNATEFVKLSVYSDKIAIDCGPNPEGQKLFALLMTANPTAHNPAAEVEALPPAAEDVDQAIKEAA